MSRVSVSLRRLVERRARLRCEYCGLAQAGQEATFHIDHIIPRADGGRTTKNNLCLCCVSCSLRKEARSFGADPVSGRVAALFHPRRQKWHNHFQWAGVEVNGLTAIGRATIDLLQLNGPSILAIRREEEARGRHPPPQAIDE